MSEKARLQLDRQHWRIEGMEGDTRTFEVSIPMGSLSEAEIIALLRRLASRHLTAGEIVAASLRKSARGYSPLLEARVESEAGRYTITVG
jgi:hypothetical protein